MMGGFLLLATLPQSPNCQKLSPITPDMDRLSCAAQAAETGRLDQILQAIALVEKWPANHPLAGEAQRLLGQWSRQVIQIARQQLRQGNLEEAVTLLQRIPRQSPLYAQTQETLQRWTGQWRRAQSLQTEFIAALKRQQWPIASQHLRELSMLDDAVWGQTRTQQLTRQLTQEQQAWQQLLAAQELAKQPTIPNLTQAFALVASVPSSSYVYPLIQGRKQQWSQQLLAVAAQNWQQGNLDGVLAAVKLIPKDVAATRSAQDWQQLAQAAMTRDRSPWVGLLDAITVSQKLSQSSAVANSAKMAHRQWQNQWQDQVQLSWAGAIAQFSHPLTLDLAIRQAELIHPQRPKRLLAQTQIAHWRKQLQIVQDRTILMEARQSSQSNELASLKGAVAKASQIQPGQPLRVEAQTWIAQWTKEIQTREDRPTLQEAQRLAQQGDFASALRLVQQIAPGRVLSEEAQILAREWVAQVQIQEDLPILDRATALAADGKLQDAIGQATKIPPGRALYREAQSAIARWQSEQEAINLTRRQAREIQVIPGLPPTEP